MVKQNAIMVIILAAGQSLRFGEKNKLLQSVNGRPLIELSVAAAVSSKAKTIVVVTGFEADKIKSVISGYPVTFIDNPRFNKGMSTSIVAALQQVNQTTTGVMIMLADMHKISSRHIDHLIDAFVEDGGQRITVPCYNKGRGNPVLWPVSYVKELKVLKGDHGGRHILKNLETLGSDRLCRVEMLTDAIFFDVDEIQDIKQ